MLHEASVNTHTPKTRARNSVKFCPQVRYMFINAFKSVPFSSSIWKTTFLKIFVNVGPRILRNKTYIIVSTVQPKKTLSRQTLNCSYWHFKVLGNQKVRTDYISQHTLPLLEAHKSHDRAMRLVAGACSSLGCCGFRPRM